MSSTSINLFGVYLQNEEEIKGVRYSYRGMKMKEHIVPLSRRGDDFVRAT